ncbi:MAG: hypothetical protein PWP23_1655 [Candidatus Sumerlaeota bacterium]|nr:hypothetical protein [Candidatus Sumerlaeota bacterium]
MKSALRHSLASLVAAAAPAALFAQGIVESEPEPGPVEVTFTVADLPWLFGILAVFLLIGYFLLRHFREKYGEQVEEITEGEREFEQKVLTQYTAFPPAMAPSAAAAPSPAVPPPPDVPAAPAWPASGTGGAAAAPAGAPEGIDDLVRRLQQLAVLGNREGQMKMPIPPDAPIHRLRKGGVAVILPRVESQALLVHCAKRFDVVFAMTDSEEVLVFERLQGRLNDLMDDRRP